MATPFVVRLTRKWSTPFGTFGEVWVDGHTSPNVWWSLEREPNGDYPRIPAGTYPLARGMYYGGDGVGGKPDYACWVVTNVRERSQIKIHIANLARQLRGCIALGKSLGCIDQSWAVLQSAHAFKEFMGATATAVAARLIVSDPPEFPL